VRFWYYHDILILNAPWYIFHIPHHGDILILSWYFNSKNKAMMDIILIYQNIKPLHPYSNASKHLRLIFISLFHIQATFEIYMILILIFWSYHDIVILSWCIKISSPSSDIQANIWDFITDIIMTLWYYHEISNYQTAFPTKFVLPSTLNLELLNNKDNKNRQGTVFLVFTWKEKQQQQQEILVLAKHYDVCKILRNLIKILGTRF